MSDYDSLDEIIGEWYSFKLEFDTEEMRAHILQAAGEQIKKEGISYEAMTVMYACEIQKKLMINYYIYDEPMEVHYQDNGLRITRRPIK